eukprot:1344040-Amphidinium_carterae.1
MQAPAVVDGPKKIFVGSLPDNITEGPLRVARHAQWSLSRCRLQLNTALCFTHAKLQSLWPDRGKTLVSAQSQAEYQRYGQVIDVFVKPGCEPGAPFHIDGWTVFVMMQPPCVASCACTYLRGSKRVYLSSWNISFSLSLSFHICRHGCKALGAPRDQVAIMLVLTGRQWAFITFATHEEVYYCMHRMEAL